MTYNLFYFLGNKAFVIDFLETGYSVVCICGQLGKNCPGRIDIPHQNSDGPIVQSGQSGKNCPGKIDIPHQNSDGPIVQICLVCCCYLSTIGSPIR